MKRVLTLSTLVLLIAVCFSACQKIETGTPPAIRKLIREKNKWDKIGCQVDEYLYTNDYVYIWWCHDCMDCKTIGYDEKANTLWVSGGYAGGTTFPKDFHEKATFKRTVWRDKRLKD